MTRPALAILAVLCFSLAPAAVSQSSPEEPEGPEDGFKIHPEAGKQPAFTLGSGRTCEFFQDTEAWFSLGFWVDL